MDQAHGHITSGQFYWRWDTPDGPKTRMVTFAVRWAQGHTSSSDYLPLLDYLTAITLAVIKHEEKHGTASRHGGKRGRREHGE
jgi:hypothetical protein